MTITGIRGVRLDNRKVLRAQGPKTKYFERLFFSFNKLYGFKFFHNNFSHLKQVLKQLPVYH